MKNDYQIFVGIDVSKGKLDYCLISKANKKIKTILNMAALTAKKYDPELKFYFDKKVAEGKNKMLVMNAIRCKLISRAFAVIKRNSKFVNTLKAVA